MVNIFIFDCKIENITDMSKLESIARYNLIIQKLRIKNSTFEEISDYLQLNSEIQGYNFNISKRTFQRDLNDINTLYSIDIQYNSTLRAYYINDEGHTDATKRIMESFDILNAFNMSVSFTDFVHFEQRRPIGTENLGAIIDAIQKRVRILFSYKSFVTDTDTIRTVEPFGLKEFRNRWYVLAEDIQDKRIKNFALDRLSNLTITNIKFSSNKQVELDDYFKQSFGVYILSDSQPEEIILSFSHHQAHYIKTLPLHHSQQIISSDENFVIVKLYMYITQDFVMELLSYANQVKVIAPPSLAENLIQKYKDAIAQYNQPN